ncbi:clostripain-related cysteine peptidase, partial [Prevotella sp.]|uniref:clostripain-related cysteine peptidase n=1 Tax=Prevotella sp. TaxID=59823 RepID=UPI0027E346D9
KDKKQSALIDIRYKKGVCTQDTLEKYSSPTYLTTNGRVELFNKVKKYAPANRYAMIVGCHGMGWIPSSTVFNRNTLRYFGGLEKEYKIDIDDFATSIKAAGMKMQFIMFDDCYMSSMEVAYDLKDVTDYIIASTSEVMAYGMPYQNIYQHLMSAQPDYKALCNGFYEFYSNSGTPYGTIGVTDCRYMDEMVAMMKYINTKHTFDTDRLNNVQDLDGETFTPTIFFDFDDYVRNLCTNDNNTYEQFNAVLQRLVPYKANTNYILSGETHGETKVNHFSGITISDPSTRSEIKESKKHTNWWIQTH